MRTFMTLMAFALVLGLARAAEAQTNLPGGVLTQEERTIIRDYFGQKVGEVLGRRTGTTASSTEDKDDDKEASSSSKRKNKKAKKHKKGKGHAKGKGRKGLPPGLAKRNALPPGLQRQLDARGSLPPGLRTEDLPTDLEKQLPPIKDNFKRVIVDDAVVLIEQGTNRVLDILEGVLSGRQTK